MLLNKDQIFAIDDIKTKIVDIPEWGGEIKLRVLSVGAQIKFDEYREDDKKAIMYSIINSCVNEDVSYLFNEEDIQHLEQKDPNVIMRLFNEIISLNKQKENDIEELAKN